MFFLRCAFFLSIVYSSMSWTNGALEPHGFGARVIETAHAETGRLMGQAVAGATDLCTRHAAECLADAARLTSLFAAVDAAPAPEPSEADAKVERERAQRPVPTVRRHGRDAKLARAF